MSRSGSLLRHRVLHHFLQFAALEQLQRDIAAADQLAADEDLWKGRPIGVPREIAVHLGIFKDVHIGIILAAGSQRLGGAARKSALRKVRSPLQEDHNGILFAFLPCCVSRESAPSTPYLAATAALTNL